MHGYRVSIDTSAYQPYKRFSKENWKPDYLNRYMAALHGWTTTEPNLQALKWRLLMFCGGSPLDDEFQSEAYQKWFARQKNRIHFSTSDGEENYEILITPPGFRQGYFNVDKYIEKVKTNGYVEIPFWAVYDPRQYNKRMDGCAMIVQRLE